jgi:hypothetical protein
MAACGKVSLADIREGDQTKGSLSAPQNQRKDSPMKMYIGLDVHSEKTVYVAQDEAGSVVGEGSVATTPQGFCRMVETLDAPQGTK